MHKPFVCHSYEKHRGGGTPHSFVTSATPRPYSLERGGGKPFGQAFAAGRRQWTGRAIAGTLLVTRRVSRRGNPPSPAVRACSSRAPTVSVSLTNHKRKASKHVQETPSRCDDCISGMLGSHISSSARSEAREVQQLQRVFRSHASSPARTNPSGKGSRGPISRENETRRPGCHQRPL